MNTKFFSLFNYVDGFSLLFYLGTGILLVALFLLSRKRKPSRHITEDDILSILERTPRGLRGGRNWLPFDILIQILQAHYRENTISVSQVRKLLHDMNKKGIINFELPLKLSSQALKPETH